jgi:hypothetical protein
MTHNASQRYNSQALPLIEDTTRVFRRDFDAAGDNTSPTDPPTLDPSLTSFSLLEENTSAGARAFEFGFPSSSSIS